MYMRQSVDSLVLVNQLNICNPSQNNSTFFFVEEKYSLAVGIQYIPVKFGHKYQYMIEMDFKGIRWVGNVYQKFEAMCLEVEEIMYEDTVNFVGNQVQTVGASMKKFYSEVMQDVLPPSCIDPVKVAAADLSVNPYADFGIHKKPKASTKKDNLASNMCVSEDSKVKSEPNVNSSMELFLEPNRDMGSNGKSSGVTKRTSRLQSEVSRSFTPVSKDLKRISTCGEMGKNYDVATDQIGTELCKDERSDSSWVEGFEYDASTTVSTTDMIISSESVAKKEKQLKDASSQGPHDMSSPGINGACRIDSTMESYISCDPINCESGCGDSITTGEANVDCNESDEDIAKPRTEDIQDFDKSNCVVVGRYDLSVAAPKEDKTRSYRRKIRKAFSSKRSTRKQEYEQLAVQHCCLGTGAGQDVADGSMPRLLNEEKLLPHRILESEWEIL